jgi:hypothetical protein
MHYKTCLIAAAFLLHAPTWAINKCTGPGGKISFQDAPCIGQGDKIAVKPASGFADPTTETTQTRTRANLDTLQNERMRREKWIVLNDARKGLDDQRAQCADEQKRIASTKARSNNNLAGATRDVSISQEMTAAAMACDSLIRGKEKEIESAEKVCSEVKCIPAF